MAKYRSTNIGKTGNSIIAISLLALDPELREMIDKQIKPKEPPIKVTPEDITVLQRHVKLEPDEPDGPTRPQLSDNRTRSSNTRAASVSGLALETPS